MQSQVKTASWNDNKKCIEVRYKLNDINVVASYQVYESVKYKDNISPNEHINTLIKNKFHYYLNYNNEIICHIGEFNIGVKTNLIITHPYGKDYINVLGIGLHIDSIPNNTIDMN